MGIINVNCIGDKCPVPVVKTIKAINGLTEPGILEVHVDNEIAVQNIKKLASGKGFPITMEKLGDEDYKLIIQVENVGEAMDESVTCKGDTCGNIVVAIAGKGMGHGSDELAATLIKGFIYALSQQETLPSTILFYNGGAFHTCEGSASLDDLKNMEAMGVEILTCGTCLDYFGLKEKLAVGKVTNMYVIVEKMMKADKIIKQ